MVARLMVIQEEGVETLIARIYSMHINPFFSVRDNRLTERRWREECPTIDLTNRTVQ